MKADLFGLADVAALQEARLLRPHLCTCKTVSSALFAQQKHVTVSVLVALAA